MVDEALSVNSKIRAPVPLPFAHTDSLEYGVDVPIPSKSVAVFIVVNPPEEVNAPPPPPVDKHVPFTAKQPADISIPCAKVEVAVLDALI